MLENHRSRIEEWVICDQCTSWLADTFLVFPPGDCRPVMVGLIQKTNTPRDSQFPNPLFQVEVISQGKLTKGERSDASGIHFR